MILCYIRNLGLVCVPSVNLSWLHVQLVSAAMRFLLPLLLAASLRRATSSTSSFDELLTTLGSLGNSEANTTLGPFRYSTNANATGAGNPCARTVRPETP